MDQQQQANSSQQYRTPDGQGQPAPTEPPKGKKTGLLVALIVVLVVILGVIAFMMLGSSKKGSDGTKAANSSSTNSKETNVNSEKFQSYEVSDKATGANYTVSFYKDASTSEKSGRTFLTSGASGSQHSIYFTTAKAAKLDCQGTPSTTMRLNGESTTVCYESNSTLYAGYVTVKNVTIQLNLAGQKAVSMEDAKAIMESVTFK